MTKGRVLLITIPPFEGGVPSIAALMARILRDRGYDVTVGYYATLGNESEYVVPLWRILSGARPSIRQTRCFDGIHAIGVGCWLPEFEVGYYAASKRWDELVNTHDYHLVIGGNVLPAFRLVRRNLRHLIWCATPFFEERRDRQAHMSFLRQLFDKIFIVPILSAMERYVLSHSDLILPISRYTAGRFKALGRKGPMSVLTVPVDTEEFLPPRESASIGVIGFAGRINDPRKNIVMLFEAVALAREKGVNLTLRLTGLPDAKILKAARHYGIEDNVDFLGHLEQEQLPEFYQSLDVFALPSYQEGLGIVGIEAMSAGLPIVSTYNGGAEDYVFDGENGQLVGFSAQEMSEALMKIVLDRDLRNRFSQRSREIALENYRFENWERGVEIAWQAVWGSPL